MRFKAKVKRRNQQRRKLYQLKVIRAITKAEQLHHHIWNHLQQTEAP